MNVGYTTRKREGRGYVCTVGYTTGEREGWGGGGCVCKLHYGGTGRMGEVVLYVVYTIGEREKQGEVVLCVVYTIGEWEEQG